MTKNSRQKFKYLENKRAFKVKKLRVQLQVYAREGCGFGKKRCIKMRREVVMARWEYVKYIQVSVRFPQNEVRRRYVK